MVLDHGRVFLAVFVPLKNERLSSDAKNVLFVR
jgi:hypothetical protein